MFKYCAVLSLCAGLSLVPVARAQAPAFVTGQGARLVIGQTTFTSQTAGASATLLGGVGGIAWANGQLWVADSNRLGLTPLNHRVLRIPTQGFPQPLDEIPEGAGRCPVCVGEADLVLGQEDFEGSDYHITRTGFRLPTGIATDGHMLVVADTQNNRVLLWSSMPTQNTQPPDIVLGQSSFDSLKRVEVDAKSFRAPQGVWIQNGKLFVADTQNHRVLIWNSIPTQNEQPADVVLGQASFTAAVEPLVGLPDPHPDNLLNPVSVTSDGVRLFVADLGHNRVLIWNSIPTQNQQPADVVIGQPDFTTAIANDVVDLCQPLDENQDGEPDTDDNGNTLYPARCSRTLDFPRYALSNGEQLFVADGGNDRVLVFNTIPTGNAATPDVILGQPDEFSSVVSSVTDLFNPLLRQSAADIIATPTALAWDGTNLYATDASNRRVLVFTPGEPLIPINGVRNAASREIFALGSIGVRPAQEVGDQGFIVNREIQAGDVVTIQIGDTEHVYTTVANDTVESIMVGIAESINGGAGDPLVFAKYEPLLGIVKLQAKIGGRDGNDISITITIVDKSGESNASIQVAANGSSLEGGQDAAVIAPGTLVTMLGEDLASVTESADLGLEKLPTELGKVQAYFDGIRSPVVFVSPTQVNSQVPFEVLGSNNVSFYLRIERDDGSVIVTTAIAVPIDEQNPGIFAEEGEEPRAVVAYHASSHATGTITVDGQIEEGDLANVEIEDRTYTYRVKSDDTLTSVRDALVAMINANPDEAVVATPVGAFHRIELRSKIAGPAGEGIRFVANSSEGDNSSVFLILSSTSGRLCCANVQGAPITALNPAIPGEHIYLFATGLGPIGPQVASNYAITGQQYHGPVVNDPLEFVSSLAGGSTANVVSAGLEPGAHGIYRVVLELSPGMDASRELVPLTISQFIYTSNTVNLLVRDPSGSNVGQ